MTPGQPDQTTTTERRSSTPSDAPVPNELEQIAALTPDLLATVDRDGTVRWANDAWRALTVLPPGSLPGRPLAALLGTHAADALLASAGRGETHRVRAESVAADGQPVTLEWAATPDRTGAALALVGRDVTDQEAVIARLQRAEASQSLGVMAAGVAHDFNNLLAGLSGHIAIARSHLPTAHPAHENLEQADAGAGRAAELTQQLLAYAGRTPRARGAVPLNALVREMSALLRSVVPRSIELGLDLDGDDPIALAEGTQVRQVLMNLITNANEAIGEKPGVLAIRTGRAATGSMLVAGEASGTEHRAYIEVEDDGCGMDSQTRLRMFDPFFSQKFAGRGLGLASVLGIVRTHKGGVEVESSPGAGTRVRVLLPESSGIAPEPIHDGQAHATPSPPTAPGSERPRALVVDDEPLVRDVVTQALTMRGYEVTDIADGLEAVAAFDADPSRFDIVVMDLTMPKLDGIGALRHMRKTRPELPAVLISGYAREDTGVAEEPRSRFLQKPFALDELLNAVHALASDAQVP